MQTTWKLIGAMHIKHHPRLTYSQVLAFAMMRSKQRKGIGEAFLRRVMYEPKFPTNVQRHIRFLLAYSAGKNHDFYMRNNWTRGPKQALSRYYLLLNPNKKSPF